METLTNLNTYINTSDFNFNRCALRLYFGNVKQPVFSYPSAMLAIFTHIIGKTKECKGEIFSFVDWYQPFLLNQTLTPQQDSLICSHVISYLRAEVNERNAYYDYSQNYLNYFQVLAENADLQKQEALIAGEGIGGVLDDVLKKQVIKLSQDLNDVTSAQKVKAITSLLKTLPEFTKPKKETPAPLSQHTQP